jgi:glycosyltransferase involved in cell wall biosynthesis
MVAHTDAPWTPLYSRALLARGWAVRIASFSPAVIDGVDSEFVGERPSGWFPSKHLYVTRARRVRVMIDSFRPDVVFAPYVISNGTSVLLSGWSGPFVVSAQGGDVMRCDYPHVYHALRWPVARQVCRRAHAVHVVSADLGTAVLRMGVPQNRIHCFPSGIDLAAFRPPELRPIGGATRLVCTRKHDTMYDNATILEALARLLRAGRDFRCSFIGGGPLGAGLRRHSERLGLGERVSFEGEQPHGAIPSALRGADLYVSASLADGTSASLLEALACGTFPVVSRISANRRWVRDGETGFLFGPSRPSELAEALARAIDRPRLRRRAAKLNRSLVEREGDLDRCMDRLSDMLLAAPRRRAA